MLPGQPGYLSLTAGIFSVFESSNFFARFWPALIGTVLVLIPILFRKFIGNTPAVLLATFLAVDPLLISVSRSASGTMLALVGLLAGIGFLLNRKYTLSGIAFGLALVGGQDLWPGLAAFALAILLSTPSFRNLASQFSLLGMQKGNLKATGITAIVTTVFLSTLFFLKFQVISTLGSSLVEYVNSWSIISPLKFYAAGSAWLVIMLPGVIFGVWGFVSGTREKKPLVKLLGYWFAIAFIAALINPSRHVLELFWASIPMWTLAAMKVVAIFENSKMESRLICVVEAGAVIALFIFSFLYFTNLVNSVGVDPIESRNRLIGMVLPLILIVILTFLLAKGWSVESAKKGLFLGFFILLFTGLVGSSLKAANFGTRFENEIWSGNGSPVGYRYLSSTLTDLSKWSTGQDKGIDILVVGLEKPSLNWALRNYEKVSYDSVFNPNLSPSIILTRVDTEIEAIASYRGQKIGWLAQPDYQNMSIVDWLKWALFRKAPQDKFELLLWARNDLFTGIDS